MTLLDMGGLLPQKPWLPYGEHQEPLDVSFAIPIFCWNWRTTPFRPASSAFVFVKYCENQSKQKKN